MPSEHLIDFGALDLSRTLIEKRRILEVLKQRGRFEMVDGVLHMDLGRKRPASGFPMGASGQDEGLIVGYKEVRRDDWWAQDHIPGRPLFPGALMIEAAAQLCTFHFLSLHPELETSFIGFGGVDEVRFRATVEPDCRFIMVGKVLKQRSRMFLYESQGFVDQKLVFEAGIRGVVV